MLTAPTVDRQTDRQTTCWFVEWVVEGSDQLGHPHRIPRGAALAAHVPICTRLKLPAGLPSFLVTCLEHLPLNGDSPGSQAPRILVVHLPLGRRLLLFRYLVGQKGMVK